MADIYILSNTKVTGAKKLPVITQKPLPQPIDFSLYDYLLFTSKNGVKALNSFTNGWKEVPALVIGKATGDTVTSLGGTLYYTASSFYGEDFAKEVSKLLPKSGRILLLKPKKVVSDIKSMLEKEGFCVYAKTVYETLCNCPKLPPPPKGSAILFSSPSTVECFLKCFGWDESYRAFALGKKSAQAFDGPVEIVRGKTLQEGVDYIKNLV